MGKFLDLTGEKFGRLTVIECAGKNKHNHYQWLCECNCNKHTKKIVSGCNLRQGNVKSCGCLVEEGATVHKKHGLSRERISITYRHMKDRCLNPKNEYYQDYGGRGITVCDEWLEKDGFISFCEWAFANGYNDSLTLDRINNDKGYSPNNCRWTTQKIQNINKRNNHYVEINGEKKTVKEWCDIYGISTHTFYYRRRELKMSEIEALIIPVTTGGICGSRKLR